MNSINRRIAIRAGLFLAALSISPAVARSPAMRTEKFEFVSDGRRLSGFIDMPGEGQARATIVIVHGYGRTDVAGNTSWLDLRARFTALGIATVIWDRPGCGQSEGTFDANQPVSSSAQEVLDAVRSLRERGMPGAGKIGLWGISRAGWIAPLAMSRDPGIAFWISVSGTDDKESFPYLLESNLRIEGRSEAEIAALLVEWHRGFEITRGGGSFEAYRAATARLWSDPFMAWLSNGAGPDEASFLTEQRQFQSGAFTVDEASGLMIYVPGFRQMLSGLNVPVLAIFGEKDSSVDWRATMALYSETIGRNPRAALTIRTFPDGNHNLQQALTGGLREMIEMRDRRPSAGYFEAMEDWLRKTVLR